MFDEITTLLHFWQGLDTVLRSAGIVYLSGSSDIQFDK